MKLNGVLTNLVGGVTEKKLYDAWDFDEDEN